MVNYSCYSHTKGQQGNVPSKPHTNLHRILFYQKRNFEFIELKAVKMFNNIFHV